MKLKSLLIPILLFAFQPLEAQIIYEASYPFLESRVQITNIGDDEYKYIYTDYSVNELKIFNLNHTSYATISVPIVLENAGKYIIAYVTKSLFDCDTNKLEYAIISPTNWRNSFYIYREDGTQLFKQDSTLAPYCFGCFSGSYDMRPIVNTPEGAKLLIAKSDVGTFENIEVYSLCGSLPNQIDEPSRINMDFVKVYPNPSTSVVHFDIDRPNNFELLTIEVFSAEGRYLKGKDVGAARKQSIEMEFQTSGLHLFYIRSENRVYQSGKFIISK